MGVKETNSASLATWRSQGAFIKLKAYRIFTLAIGLSFAAANKTLLILHGFPESSYSLHAVLPKILTYFERIILFDMLGFGNSDKPLNASVYTIDQQADLVQAVWTHYDVNSGHLLAHDMGDSVAGELVFRSNVNPGETGLLTILLSVTLTNGGMVLELAQLRIMQHLLLSKVGKMINAFTNFNFFQEQIQSAHGNSNLLKQYIQSLWKGNQLNRDHHKFYLSVCYIFDRRLYEKSRWLPALQKTDIPLHLCWCEDDCVAPLSIAHYIIEDVCPIFWSETILSYY